MWVKADTTGYCYGMQIYEGAKYNEQGIKITTKELGKNVVLKMCEENLGQGHVIVCDNYYTSIKLAEELFQNQTYLVGQIKINANGLDKTWISNNKKELTNKGDWNWIMKRNLAIFVWNDTRVNVMLGTWPGILKNESFESTITRTQKKIKEQRKCPYVANIYNKYMGGVDLFGAHIARCSTNIKSKKWWLAIFWHCLDTAVVNSWLNWKLYSGKELSL